MITSATIELVSVTGTSLGIKPTAFVLERKKTELSILLTRPALPDGTPPVAQLISKTDLDAKIHAHELKIAEREKLARLTEAKEKVFQIASTIGAGDLKHKLKSMKDALEKGDKVRVVVAVKKKPDEGPLTPKEVASLKDLKDKIVEHLGEAGTILSEVETATGKGPTSEMSFNPKVSKKTIFQQKLKEKEAAGKKNAEGKR